MMFERIDIKNDGNDTYFVTDLHGCYDLLLKVKKEIGYLEPEKNGLARDRMISCGDLNDRGLRSYDLMQLFRFKPGMHAVLGNHEEMGYLGLYGKPEHELQWYHNGGMWAYDLELDKSVLKDVFSWAVSLPHAMEVNFEGGPSIGVVHGGIPEGTSWQELQENLMEKESVRVRDFKSFLLWDRTNINEKKEHDVKGIDYVLHGHSHSKGALELGNRVYFDTGAIFSRPGSKYCLTLLKYMKNKNGNVAGGWLQEMTFYIDIEGNLVWK